MLQSIYKSLIKYVLYTFLQFAFFVDKKQLNHPILPIQIKAQNLLQKN